VHEVVEGALGKYEGALSSYETAEMCMRWLKYILGGLAVADVYPWWLRYTLCVPEVAE
jgi:hypothetical protein